LLTTSLIVTEGVFTDAWQIRAGKFGTAVAVSQTFVFAAISLRSVAPGNDPAGNSAARSCSTCLQQTFHIKMEQIPLKFTV
jgi:hypothetical protein